MINSDKIEAGIELLLKGLGCKLSDPNFRDTPERYAKMMIEMFEKEEADYTIFPETYSDFVLLKRHSLWSLCPHHLLPVKFIVSLAYIPDGKVVGLSKLARLLDDINNGPLLQERFTHMAVDRLRAMVKACKGAACLVEGHHGCMQVRGIRSEGSVCTYRLEGLFLDRPHIQELFFNLCRS